MAIYYQTFHNPDFHSDVERNFAVVVNLVIVKFSRLPTNSLTPRSTVDYYGKELTMTIKMIQRNVINIL